LIELHEREKTFPFDIFPELAKFGYFGGWLPEELGGLGIPRSTWAMMIEELGYWWPSLRTMVNISNGPIYRLAKHGTPEQKQKYLKSLLSGHARVFNAFTEPDTGSDIADVQTKAVL